MKIALVQSHIIPENKRINIDALKNVLRENPDADAFFLPEMSFTGFSMNTAAAADRDQETLTEMCRLAAGQNVYLGFGWVRPAGEKCHNVYTVVDKNGEAISEYVKIHPFSYAGEDKYFTGGKSISTFDICGVPFASFICYDLRFPELFRAVCGDVHAVIIPANWPEKRSEHWKTLLRARAIENQVYIFAVNCAGDMDGAYYSGDSCIIDPDGKVIEMLSDEPGIIKYDFTDDTERYRNAFPVLQDRKPFLYLHDAGENCRNTN